MLKTIVKGCEPKLATKYSAAVDLFASEDVVVGAGETKVVGLGVCIDLENLRKILGKEVTEFIEDTMQDDDEFAKQTTYTYLSCSKTNKFLESHYLELHPRSSLRAKGLISNTGIIDLDYKDEIKIMIHNPYTESIYKVNDRKFRIKKGDKIAQILLKEHKTYLMGIASNEERTGGFGSSKMA